MLFEKFTDRARKVMALANQEAQRFSHEYVGSEHILLGLVKEGSGIGANVLQTFKVDLRKVRLEVEKLIKSGPDMVTMGKLPHTPHAKKVIEYAIEEARNLNHEYIDTEHLLMGMLRDENGVAAQVLMNLGLNLEEVRKSKIFLLNLQDPTHRYSVLKSTNTAIDALKKMELLYELSTLLGCKAKRVIKDDNVSLEIELFRIT